MITLNTAIDGTETNQREVELTRINNDVNGNPRHAFHFLELINEGDRIKAYANRSDNFGVSSQYNIALIKAKKMHGRKYHNRSFGGGISFQSGNLRDDIKLINELREVNTNFKKDWDKKDWRKAKSAINNYFAFHAHKYNTGGESFKFNPFNYDQISNILGLAYTSSGDYAGLWIYNVELQADDKYNFIGFAINENNEVVGVCQDKDEKEVFISL